MTETERLLEKKRRAAQHPNDVFEVRRIDDDDYAALGLFAKLRVSAHKRQTAYTLRAADCHACGLCVVACPENAITLLPPTGGR